MEDTGRATVAMTRSNEIAQNAQRPWVNIDAELTHVGLIGGRRGLELGYKLTFKNTGSMIANDFQGIVKFVPMDNDAFDHMDGWFEKWRENRKPTPSVLIPNEEAYSVGEATYAIDALPWFGDERDVVHLIVLAAAYYRLPYENEWRVNERAFSIGVRGDPFVETLFFNDFSETLSLDDLVMRKFGRSVAN